MNRIALAASLATLPFLAACGAPDETPGDALATHQDDIRIMNGLSPQALALNALTTNPTASQYLISHPLSSTTFSSGPWEIRTSLHDPAAMAVFDEIVRCALGRYTTVSYTDPFTTTMTLFHGELGLAPGWASGAASATDQANVSACVLSRMNAYGRHVSISLRGDVWNSGVNAVDASGPTRADILDYSASVLPYFQACATTSYGPTRDCGWVSDQSWVGACTPGSTVSVGVGGSGTCGGAPLGSGSGDTMLRICNGTHGCLHDYALAEDDDSGCTLQSYVTFTCPYSARGDSTGNFTVMVGAYASDSFVSTTVGSTAETPAPEVHVYRQAEAGWMGNIFAGINPYLVPVAVNGNGGVNGNQQSLPWSAGAVYPHMGYCQAPGWGAPDAYATSRLCGNPSTASNCAAAYLGSCSTRCSTTSAQGAFESCYGVDGYGVPSLTSYLFTKGDIIPTRY